MPCPLLERYVSFLPDEDQYDVFAACDVDGAEAGGRLRSAVCEEAYNKDRTRRRVGDASNLILAMLYMGRIKQLCKEMLEKGVVPYTRTADVLDVEHLDHWLAYGARRLRELIVAHVEFMLDSEEVRRGARQLEDQHRMRVHSETEALCEAVRVVQKYIKDPTGGHAGLVGQHLYRLCGEHGSTAFAVQCGFQLLEVT